MWGYVLSLFLSQRVWRYYLIYTFSFPHHTGLYFSAALLHVYSASLLTMTGPRIRQWIEEVSMNKTDWYTTISVGVPVGVSGKSGSGGSSGEGKYVPESWDAFVNGWIHCTTGMYFVMAFVVLFDSVVSIVCIWQAP